jgi:disulfide bond formation protein DsbB
MKTLPYQIEENTALRLNAVAMLLLALPLVGAMGVQLIFHELPCPLCLLQRIGMFAVAFGLILNLKYGSHPLHYGLSSLGAMIGAAVSLRQIVLHIVPVAGEPTGFGAEVLGMHLYTWAFVVFVCSMIGIALLLIFTQWQSKVEPTAIDTAHPREMTRLEKFAVWLFVVLLAANVILAFLECGFGACPDNPSAYMLLQ